MLQVVEDPIHLVHLPLRVAVLYPQLIAVGLSDGPVRVCPLVPDAGAQVMDVVGFLLPDPEQLIHGGLPVGAPQGEDGKFPAQVVAVDDAEFFDGVGGRTVLPAGADGLVGVPDAAGQDIPAVLQKKLVSAAHKFLLARQSRAVLI